MSKVVFFKVGRKAGFTSFLVELKTWGCKLIKAMDPEILDWRWWEDKCFKIVRKTWNDDLTVPPPKQFLLGVNWQNRGLNKAD